MSEEPSNPYSGAADGAIVRGPRRIHRGHGLVSEPLELDVPGFLERVRHYANGIPNGERRILAIAGAPASGKSTLAAALCEELGGPSGGACALLPMDGFHYDDEVLGPRGWQSRKGAPHTFDVGGYASALERLRRRDEDVVAVPRFDRSIEIARAGAILIERDVPLIVTEGNYLLLRDEPWPRLRPSFDVTVFVALDLATLEARNRRRWVGMGMGEAEVRAKLEENDMPNARRIIERSERPDWLVRT